MNELFIIIIILIVLWFINEHTKKVERFESNGEKIELSLCDLVTLFKKIIVREVHDAHQRQPHQPQQPQLQQPHQPHQPQQPQLQQPHQPHQPQPQLPQLPHQLQQIVADLEHMPIENKNMNMNIINNVEPHDSDDLHTNHSLLESA
jgi:hypothetical protein